MTKTTVEIQPLTETIIRENINRMIDMSQQLKGDYWTLEHYLSDLNRKWELSSATFCDGRFCGFIIVSEKPESLHVHRIVIAKELQGQGIGKKLIHKSVQDARQVGKPLVTLKAEADNAQSLGFYKGLGFEITGEQGILVLMQLKVTP